MSIEPDKCKICRSSDLYAFAHTAKCRKCGVLLYYPYPENDKNLVTSGTGKAWSQEDTLSWYQGSSFLNHVNFTAMTRFTMDESCRNRELDILDFGGGGGQFALVCKSHFPQATVFITDISDESLLPQWRQSNIQILYKDFSGDGRKFDFIFLNDVFEHVSDPLLVLQQLSSKLKPNGKIFIDTPKQFWIYPFTEIFSKGLFRKVLRGTVSTAHLQIWSRAAFNLVVQESGLKICKYEESSEYTMPADFYLKNMGITNPVIRFAGRLFYRNAKYLAKNKIVALLERQAK